MNKLALALCLALALGWSTPSLAAEFRTGESIGIKSEETIFNNLYAAGSSVTVAGAIEGDASLAGGTVLVNGPIDGDVNAAAGTVSILADVGGDVRVAAGNVVVVGKVGGDLIVAGGTVRVLPSAVIEKDVVVYGGTVVLEGALGGNVQVKGGTITIASTIQGDVRIASAQSFALTDKAVIKGDLDYMSPAEILVPTGAVVEGLVSYEPYVGLTQGQVWRTTLTGLWSFYFLTELLALLTAAFLLIRFVSHHRLQSFIVQAHNQFPRAFTRGLLVAFIVPAVLVILLATIAGSYVAAVGFLVYVLGMLIAKVLGGMIMGSLIWQRLKHKSPTIPTIGSAWAGITLLHILGVIPVLGWLLQLIFTLVAFGVLAHFVHERIIKHPAGLEETKKHKT